MQIKCDKCDKPATIHLTDIVNGQKNEVHLCEECAISEGIKSSMPVSQLLQEFVLQSSNEPAAKKAETACEVCGITFNEFRQQGLLGCPHDYDVFSAMLEPLLERAHDGGTQHIGKMPRKADVAQKKHSEILRLRAALRQAVTAEDYEKAARLRDQIKELE